MLTHFLALGGLGAKRTVALDAEGLVAGSAAFASPALGIVSPVVPIIPAPGFRHGFAVYPAGPMRARISHFGPVPALRVRGGAVAAPALHQHQVLTADGIVAGKAKGHQPLLKRSFARTDNAFWLAAA